MKTSPQMKRTDLPWAEAAPAHWQRTKLKRLFKVQSGDFISPVDEAPEGFPIYGGNDLRGYTTKWNTEGPILLLGRVGARCGCVRRVDGQFWASEHALRMFAQKSIDLKFMEMLLTVINFNKFAVRTAQPLITGSQVGAQDIELPPPAEQLRIAYYLDNQTAKIDRLMDLRRRQIALLKEQRAALVQQAVTRGLNPNAPMKDSGISWLGEIPAHWEVKRGRFLVCQGRSSVKPGPFGTQLKTSDYVQKGIKVFNQENVISGDFERGDDFITPQKFAELSEFEVQAGDLLLTTRGTIGHCAIVLKDGPKAIIHPCLMRIRFEPSVISNNYAVAFIEGTNLFLRQVNYLSNATTIEVIYSENFRQCVFPVPPIEEQQAIAAWLRNPNMPVNVAINAYARQLTLLAEYRAALIHECVTGQRLVPDRQTPAEASAHAL